MRPLLLLLLPAFLAAQSTTVTIAKDARHVEYPVENFYRTINFGGAAFSPAGDRILYHSNATGVFNAYEQRLDGSGTRALTGSRTDAIRVVDYFPGDERILYMQNRGGNELDHVYVRETDGTVRDLTPGDSVKAFFVDWARDGRTFFVATNERDRRYFDLYEVATTGYAKSLLARNDSGFDIGAVSRDRRWIAFNKSRTTNDSDIWLLDRERGILTKITPHQGNVEHNVADFDAGSRALFYTSNEGSEFSYLVKYDLATGARQTVVKPEWDVMFASVSRGGKYLVVAVNADARTDLRVYELATMKPVRMPRLGDLDINSVSFSADDRRMAFYASSSRSPRNLYVMDVGGDSPRRLTDALNGQLDPQHLVDSRVVRFRSYDGLEVPGVLYVPRTASSTNRAPALVMVHGGPGGQARVGWNPLIQYLVNHGYVVFDINNRGSSGYGKTFFAMDDRKHGEADLGDVVDSKKMLVATGVVDPNRIGIIGGSYGGYMVLAALTLRPTEFNVGVDIFGPSNWVRTLESIPPWWASFREALFTEMGDPKTDAERLRRISPVFNAEKIQRPLLVLQGANDPRVLQRESDEIVEKARKNGVPVEYIVFPDEGHGFAKRENQLRGYGAILQFLDTHLKKSGKPVS
jgi:dipeptidyl aminopeptidase/acylaminoacyl peptidase